MRRFDLTGLREADVAWGEAPPDPLDAPALYEGIASRRFLGYLVDVAILAVLLAILWVALSIATVLSFGLLSPLQAAALGLLPVAYHTVFLGAAGATPGMRLFDVEIRSWTGGRLDYLQALLQTVLFYTTVALTCWLILLVALFNARARTLHDFMAGTLGVRHSRLAGGR